MSRLKTRVPRRYERPAAFRPALGDRAGELGVRAGYREGVRARVDNARAETAAAQLADQLIASGRVAVVDEPRELATVESTATLTRPAGEVRTHESVGGAITEAPKDTASGRLVTIDIIRSGWNASGSRYYPVDVLERDVPKIYGKSTQMYIDHPSATEGDDRPERSLQTLAGVFVDEPWAVRENDGSVTMRTTARVFGPWQPLIREAWDTIGVSINGNGRGDYGTAEGRQGLIIDELTSGRSVDFVTVPGAGGRVLGLLESDRPAPADVVTREAGTLGAYVESRIHLGFTELGDELYAGGYLNRAERITLSGAIGDALGVFVARVESQAPQLYQRGKYDGPDGDGDDVMTTEAAETRTREATVEQSRQAIDRALCTAYGTAGGYCWVQDFDPDAGLVWFTAADPPADRDAPIGPSRTWQQSYITSGGAAYLTGERVEVRPRTVYEPVAAATYESARSLVDLRGRKATKTTAGGPPAASRNGPNAPAITTKEGAMPEKSAEVVAREAAVARATTAEIKLARYEAGDAARPIVDQLLTEAADLPAAAATRVRGEFGVAVLPLTESNTLDEAALRESVGAAIKREQEYAAQLLEGAGVGAVRGNGAAAGAGSGIPATFGTTATTEAAGAPDEATREALVKQYMSRGHMTREAAEAAVNGRL